ncbi:16S rRNA (adenine(1518)-N(6)/adenine(1519)-N(6))-dimethyltransferase [Candidatus Uhrbacteria bacterium]|nr:16S rRNA (adenine(1518)-N(6)/adenine(1519)-N(6))-dimethyltransferase [Candidatus Uhrbacteria bacterium]
MDLLRPVVLRALCVRAGMRPDRRSGQNFLINRATLDRIVAAVDPQPGDTILEVGAGFGVLTMALAEQLKNRELRNREHGGRIIAIERDRRIVPTLRELVSPYENIEVVEGDVLALLKFILRESSDRRISPTRDARTSSTAIRVGEMLRRVAPQHKLKIAANLPYSITSDFLRLLFDAVGTGAFPPPERAVLLLQREVVDRLVADPRRPSDRKNVGMLTILTQLYSNPRRIARVPAAHFWPAPKVESAVVALEAWRRPEDIAALLGGVTRESFLRIVRRCFAQRRKQIHSSLFTRPSSLLDLGIDPTARPETLSLAQWISLARSIP